MYQLTNSTGIIRFVDAAGIPADPANSDYQQYLAWLAEGNTPEPYVAPPQPSEADTKAAALSKLAAMVGLDEAQLVSLLRSYTP